MSTSLPANRLPKLLVGLVLIISTFTSCRDQVEHTVTYATQVPVYLEVSAFRKMEVGPRPVKTISDAGKIYVYGDYLFINEPQKGIHVLDNRDPSNPQNITYIEIPGNVDLAVNSNILYADSYIDLLAFDISDLSAIKLVERVEEVFPHMFVDAERGMFVTFKDTVITTTSVEQGRGWGTWRNQEAFVSSDAAAGYGQGGSMARFTLMSGHLYAVDDYTLRLFDVQQACKPKFVKDIQLGWGIETIFPYKEKLFIGSMTGMHIYDATKPDSPIRMSVYQHIAACDPVVVNDDHAFVTLRTGNMCRFGEDVLQVLDIKDPYYPKLIKSYAMDNPHGLGLSGDYLYICEGDFGLKSFNTSNVLDIANNQLEHIENKRFTDVIPAPKSLIVTGADGVCQYDYSDPRKLKLLSCINVK
ncbi:LVIVD repeat-containing protein [Parapedobacter tibetensis]|uniref:LVIVD repeat-containing protein n=1 Tax=Parapedobacter tibetensis TaxID=2972951 RepID=UPI00214D6474|nr:hypothetical protein [Parapedobacter tibetensis]